MGKISSLIRAAGSKKRFNSAVLLAAGSGTRFGDERAKQFVEIAGESILLRSVRAFQESEEVHEIIVVTREPDVPGCRNLLAKAGMTKVTRVIAGGDTRQSSAKKGFDAINPEADFVAIHDTARCLVTPEMIEAVFEAAYVAGAAAAGTMNTDTIKRTNSANLVTETLERENTWLVQTPQIFMADMYRAASYMAEKEKASATDDCALCERLGFPVRLVDCGPLNIKITYRRDVQLAEAILAVRDREAAKE